MSFPSVSWFYLHVLLVSDYLLVAEMIDGISGDRQNAWISREDTFDKFVSIVVIEVDRLLSCIHHIYVGKVLRGHDWTLPQILKRTVRFDLFRGVCNALEWVCLLNMWHKEQSTALHMLCGALLCENESNFFADFILFFSIIYLDFILLDYCWWKLEYYS